MTQETGEATGIELYNMLVAGNKIKLTFSTIYEAAKLRSNISTIKHRQDKLALKLGLFDEADITTFTSVFTSKEPPNITVIFSFDPADKRKSRSFTYEIVDSIPLLAPNEAVSKKNGKS